ncbi:MAG: alpha/beta fold hydrolase [Proteobacteria bacterium]|nr:alpha/beta fold hydrolase [Pseudomonadota bacterium]
MNTPARRLPHVSARRMRLVRGLLAFLQWLSPRLAARVALRLFLTPVRRKLNPADEAEMYRARHHFLRCASGDPIHVYEWGEGPRTALILHGWGSHAARFTTMVRALTDRGWRVLAPDAPGHGESHGSTSSLPQFIGALDAVIEQLGPVQALVGHSMGSLAIAMRLGDSRRPPPADLARVVLISTPSGAPFLVESFEQLFGIDGATREHGLRIFRQRFGGLPEEFMALPGDAQLHLPVLLVHDAADDVVPFDHSAQLARRLPDASLITTHGLGHSGPLRDPATLTAIADFLDAV